jgi:hypothetical protein
VQVRFERHVRKAETGCWEWTGHHQSNGYATLGLKDPDGKWRPNLAHRIAFELYRGPISAGLVIDHLCRNRGCVNPEHLEVVTMGENLRRGDGPNGQHARATHCPQGHPYEGANLRWRRGWRECVICSRIGAREAQRRLRARRQASS